MSTRPATSELLLPRTDAGALAQVIGVVVLMAAIALVVRRERSLVTLAVGIGIVVLGAMALRTLH